MTKVKKMIIPIGVKYVKNILFLLLICFLLIASSDIIYGQTKNYEDSKKYIMDEQKFEKYIIQTNPKQIKFVTSRCPENAKDISYYNDKSVFVYTKKDTLYITSQNENKKIKLCNSNTFSGFSYLSSVELINVKNVDVSNITDMSSMFYKCPNLETIIGLETWDTSNVTTMADMFSTGKSYIGNGKLKHLNVSNFNTCNVTDMSDMFYGQGSIKKLNVSKWNVSKVETFDHMFADNFNLEFINVKNWDVSSCNNFNAMFNDCLSLKNISVENWDVSNAYYLSQMFERCKSLKYLNLSNWKASKCKGFYEMFNGCENIEYINLKSLFRCRSGVQNMFKDCPKLTKIVVGTNWNLIFDNFNEIFEVSNTKSICVKTGTFYFLSIST